MTAPVPQGSITGITPFTRFENGIGPQEGFNVNFLTGRGQKGSVFIPASQIGDTQFVSNAVQAMANNLHSVLDLKI